MNTNRIILVVMSLLTVSNPCIAQQSGNPQLQALPETLKRLSDDASDRSGTIRREAGYYAGNVQSSAKSTADGILAEGDRVAREMRNTYITDGKNKVRVYSTAEIDAVKQQYQDRANDALKAGSLRERQIVGEYDNRQKALAESARNLQEQLIQKPAGSDSVILQPVGTNLYVRNYQSVGEQYEHMPHVQPVRAVPQLGSYPTRESSSVLSGKLLRPALK